jgi:hypothetical protein
MMPEFSCACQKNCWKVTQMGLLHGAIECTLCDTTVLFTLDSIEYSV